MKPIEVYGSISEINGERTMERATEQKENCRLDHLKITQLMFMIKGLVTHKSWCRNMTFKKRRHKILSLLFISFFCVVM